MPRVKVCGLTRERDRRAAVEAGADAVGLVSGVSVDTPRELDAQAAADLAAGAPPFVTTVLVTMPADNGDGDPDSTASVEATADLAETVNPDALQVHGDLTAETVRTLREATGRPVVAAVDSENGSRARALDGVADAILIDSTTESGAGGTGRTHDWERTRRLARDLDTPVVLAGGLTPENVAEAAATVSPFAVDVASGVEAAGGVKDHDEVRRFVRVAGRGLDTPVRTVESDTEGGT